MIALALASLVAAAPPGKMPLLKYFGGRVLPHAHVVPVLWGPNVDSATRGGIGGFYSAAVSSLGWLDTEYGAPVGKSIGNGTAEAPVTIAPPTTMLPPLTQPLLEEDVIAELRRHFGRELQSPADPQNTVYMIHFPLGLQINAGGAISCQSGGFCALHDTFQPLAGTTSNLLVAMILDHSPGSGCERGCGISPDPFQNVTNSASHELVETVTDPDVGLSQGFNSIVGWYDIQDADIEFGHAEIADICANGGADAASLDATYVVQKEWSNAFKACIGTLDDAFSIDTIATPATLRIPNAGVPVQLAVKTTGARGPHPLATGPNVTFSVPNPPDKVTVQQATTTVNTQASITVTAAQGASLPATMMVHADSDPGPAAAGQPQTTAYALVTLTAADFTLSGPQGTPVGAGQQVSVKVQTNPGAGSDPAALTLSLTGPDGVSGSLDNSQITAGGSATATIRVDAGVKSGGTPVTVTGSSGLVTRTATLLLVVDGDDFSIALDKSQGSVVRGGTVSVAVKTLTTHGAPQSLTLSAQPPDGVGASFNPPQIQSGQTSTLTLTTGGANSFGAQPVTIAAQGPHASQQASFSLGVGQSQGGGCSSAGGAPALAALALLILRRRR
jgi:uncharacterized protein (TIGR03382 family)